MPTYIDVKPEMIRWAIDRSGLPGDDSGHAALEKAETWMQGTKKPTLRMLETFARKVMVPLGYLFLEEPPVEKISIADYRTFDDKCPRRPSPNLIDTLHDMQQRQDWMREYLIEVGADRIPFIGALTDDFPIAEAAARIKSNLGLEDDWSRSCPHWDDSLKKLRKVADQAGILVFTSGIVRLSTSRSLDPEEFRGFVLTDDYAPLIFINRNDTLSAQMFTLAHELAHLWMGRGGLFNLLRWEPSEDKIEQRCNQIAAEFLVPEKQLLQSWAKVRDNEHPFGQLAATFKVSPLVVARRALDKRLITREQFFNFYDRERELWLFRKEEKKQKKKSGGDFHATQSVRFASRFVRAIAASVGEGSLTYYDAYQLTGMRGKTFDHFITHCQEGENE